MYALNLRIPVKMAEAQAAEASIAASTSSLNEQQGFKSFVLLRPTLPDKPYVAVSFWDSRHDFETWTESADYKRLFMGSAITGGNDLHPVLEAFEVALAIPAMQAVAG